MNLDSRSTALARRIGRVLSAALLCLVGIDTALAQDEIELVEDDETEGAVELVGNESEPTDITLDDDDDPAPRLGTIVIVQRPEDQPVAGGSSHRIGEAELDVREMDDPGALILEVPGTQVRSEDGYGLRPNIGIRGASSERSKKVTLTEDGILLGPAPYSAPAAYYFPMMVRMVGVEVFKGPGTLLFGPSTIGGALNLVTRDVPGDGHEARLDAALGTDAYGKLHATYGYGDLLWGLLVEGAHVRSGGFKDIDDLTADTGFARSEAMLKARVNSDPDAALFHRVDLKLGFGHEHSNETYLGLSDADLADAPHRRYIASALDEMNWTRYQAELTYRLEYEDLYALTVSAYRHDLHRVWNKLNRFAGADLLEVLADPTSGQRRVFYDVLTGRSDSASDEENLMIGPNDRTYVSQGIQIVNRLSLAGDDLWGNDVVLGVRFHHDSIHRDHSEAPYAMQSRRLVRAEGPRLQTALGTASTLALSTWLVDELRLWRFHIAPALRVEATWMEDENELTGVIKERQDVTLIPGVGVHFAIADELGLLAGVHRGFSPVAPGQEDGVEPETSINYEAGVRYLDESLGAFAEVVGFFNDYSNLTGQCTFSQGCAGDQIDRQFNAGQVYVWGIEAAARYRLSFFDGALQMPARLAYTWTGSSFQAGFRSNDPIYGTVEEGDELPYLPEHQVSAGLGAETERYWTHLSFTWVAPMRETAGQGDETPMTDDVFMLDFSAGWRFSDYAELYVRADNLLDVSPIVSRRPFGARPSRPLGAAVGVELTF